jgi:hypothetical protein
MRTYVHRATLGVILLVALGFRGSSPRLLSAVL